MTALNHAFVKAYRSSKSSVTGKTSDTARPSPLLGGPHVPLSAAAAIRAAQATEGPLYTSETWTVHCSGAANASPEGIGVEQVSAEEPIRATVVRIDEAQAPGPAGPVPTRGRRAVRSPHWVFVPVTRGEKPAASHASPSAATPTAETTIAPPEAPASTWQKLDLTSRTESPVRFLEPAAAPTATPTEPMPSEPRTSRRVEERKPWLRPALEVDHFRWPDVCDAMIAFSGERFDRCVRQVLSTAQAGKRVIMISGHGRGEGRTTFLLCLARRLSAAGVKTAIVDGDFANPQLARRLGLTPESGWEDALAGRQSLSEVMIDSLEDKLSLLPAVGRLESPEPMAPFRWRESLEALRSHYQVVLLDAPPAAEFFELATDEIVGIDAAVLLGRGTAEEAVATAELARRLRVHDITPLGTVRNFVAVS